MRARLPLAVVSALLLTAALPAYSEQATPAPCESQAGICITPTFDAPPVQSLAGAGTESSGVHSMAQGDFNGDGVQDLATTGFGGIGTTDSAGVSVYLGDGVGSFGTQREFPAGRFPIDLTVARLRGPNAPLDLVVADAGLVGDHYAIAVLSGNGDGTFGPPSIVTTHGGANKLVAADFNGDGVEDIAITTPASSSATGTRTPEELTVLLADGRGGLGDPVEYPTGDGLSVFYDMATADFNNDGHPDVLGMDPEGLWVSLGRGDGTFLPGVLEWADPSTYLGGHDLGGPTAVTVGDFDGDGNVDAALDVDGARIDVLLGGGTGALHPATTPTYRIGEQQMGYGSGTLRAVDLTGDHKTDLVVTTGYGATLVVMPGNGDGTFGTSVIHPLPAIDDRTLAIADTNSDGLPDVVTLTSSDQFAPHNYLTVLLNRGKGQLLSPRQYSVLAPYNSQTVTATNPVGVTLTDLNSDGASDLIATEWNIPLEPLANGQMPEPPVVDAAQVRTDTHGSIAVFMGDGHGGFNPEKQYFVGGRPIGVGGADLDGDGRTDLAVVNAYSGSLSLLKGNGDGTLQPATTTPLGTAPSTIVVTDFNGDHRPDLAASRLGDNAVSVLMNVSTPGVIAFAPAASYPVGFAPAALVAADLDGDGRTDLATANNGSEYSPVEPSTLSVLIADGPGHFAPARTSQLWSSSGADALAAADLADGHVDLVAANFANNQLKVLSNDGHAGFSTKATYEVGIGPESLAVADFNGDGYDDVAVEAINDNTVSLLLGRGGGALTPVVRRGQGGPTPFGWTAFAYPTYLALGDLDRDGRPDLVTANIFAASVTVLHNTTPRPVRTCYEDDDPAISYGPSWRTVTDPAASAGHLTMTSAKDGGRRVTASFTAPRSGVIELTLPTSPSGGSGDLLVDGTFRRQVSFSGPVGSTQQPDVGQVVRVPYSSGGDHRIELRNVTGPAYVDQVCVVHQG